MDFFNRFNRKKGVLVLDPSLCSYCGLCEKRCPHKAIKVTSNSWKLKLICMKCGRCVRECPSGALSLQQVQKNN